jgi:hypothetical protein
MSEGSAELKRLRKAAVDSLQREYNTALKAYRTAVANHGAGSPEAVIAAATLGTKDGALGAAKQHLKELD